MYILLPGSMMACRVNPTKQSCPFQVCLVNEFRWKFLTPEWLSRVLSAWCSVVQVCTTEKTGIWTWRKRALISEFLDNEACHAWLHPIQKSNMSFHSSNIGGREADTHVLFIKDAIGDEFLLFFCNEIGLTEGQCKVFCSLSIITEIWWVSHSLAIKPPPILT